MDLQGRTQILLITEEIILEIFLGFFSLLALLKASFGAKNGSE